MKTSVSITRRKQTTLISRKSKRLRRKCSLRREYKKLRSLLPRTVKSLDLRHKVGVVDAAYQYIRHLQTALLDKFSSRGIPPDLAGVVGNKVNTAEDVQALALYLIRQNTNNNGQSRTHSILRKLSSPNNNNSLNHNNNHSYCESNSNSNSNVDSHSKSNIHSYNGQNSSKKMEKCPEPASTEEDSDTTSS